MYVTPVQRTEESNHNNNDNNFVSLGDVNNTDNKD